MCAGRCAYLLCSRGPCTRGRRVDADASVSVHPEPTVARHAHEEALDRLREAKPGLNVICQLRREASGGEQDDATLSAEGGESKG